jgi:hypothetical protein
MDWPLFIIGLILAVAGLATAYSVGYAHGRCDEIRHGNDHEPTSPK